MPRIHCPTQTDAPALAEGITIDLPAGAARHVQVLRMQPGQVITLFCGQGQEFQAEITAMGRSHVRVRVGSATSINRELPVPINLACVVPAGDRMDWLVEKATEMGAASFTPLFSQRSVLRLKGERAEKKQNHWQAVAIAACEQSGRNQVPPVHTPKELETHLQSLGEPTSATARWLLSLDPQARSLPHALQLLNLHPNNPNLPPGTVPSVHLLSGPEGGLTPQEEATARAAGYLPVSLGSRVLRAETAPLAVVAVLAAWFGRDAEAPNLMPL